MLALLMSLAAAVQTAPHGDGAEWLVATVGHSEWCPAGNVQLDLGTGRFAYASTLPRRDCTNGQISRPIQRGRLDDRRLAGLRTAFRRAMRDGLRRQGCYRLRDGPIIISNGGTPVLVTNDGARTQAAPDELGCWTEAANDLHRQLEAAFPRFIRR